MDADNSHHIYFTHPEYRISLVKDFHWEGRDECYLAGDAQSIADKDWAISHLTEVQEGLETGNLDQAWRQGLQLLSSIGLLAGKVLGPLVVFAPVVRWVVMQDADPAATSTKIMVTSRGEVRVRPGTLLQGDNLVGEQKHAYEIAFQDNQELLCCHADGPKPSSEADYLQLVAEVWWARQKALGLLK